MKTICMIPVRLGSRRIPKKNLRLLDGKPLIQHVLDNALAAGCFDEIWINSSDEVFKAFCGRHPNVFFYKRDPELSNDQAHNDDFLRDFMDHVESDYLIQLNTTSPCITLDTIRDFTHSLMRSGKGTWHGMKEEQIEAIYQSRALNFDAKDDMPPSQTLKPVYLFASGIMGWECKKFINTYGGGKDFGAYILKGYEAIDIDVEDDWRLAELALQAQKKTPNLPQYFGEDNFVESDVPSILHKDGVDGVFTDRENRTVYHVPAIIKDYANSKRKSWAERLVNTENNSCTLICQYKGEGNRLHFHHDWNEWWYIVAGQWSFTLEVAKDEFKDITVSAGDLVFIPKGTRHKITATGNGENVRLAVSRDKVDHVYA